MQSNLDYDIWNENKKIIAHTSSKRFFKEGEVWWCSVGLNIGEEVYGKSRYYKRPVIIIRKLTKFSCIVLPLTTKEYTGTWYYALISDSVRRYAMIHQIRMISSRRLESRISTVYDQELAQIKKAVAKMLGIF